MPTTPTPRTRIDWDELALVLGQGAPVTKVAELYGCSRVTIWKKLRTDARFQRLVAEEQARARAESAAHMEMLREKTAQKLAELLDQGNVRVVLWLAKQLGLVAADYAGHLMQVASRPSVLETAPPVNADENASTPLIQDENPNSINAPQGNMAGNRRRLKVAFRQLAEPPLPHAPLRQSRRRPPAREHPLDALIQSLGSPLNPALPLRSGGQIATTVNHV
ncbi:MAG TPA: helix-turn-helix domain-containing protein [Azospirillaceae bacterium]|nr:helix-turn-helix domain-containing protein [Azospirillaceae bacterium]